MVQLKPMHTKKVFMAVAIAVPLAIVMVMAWKSETDPWLEAYPDARNEKSSLGVTTFDTVDAPPKVLAFYRQTAADLGMTVTYDKAVGIAWHLSANDEARHRRFAIRVRAAPTDQGSAVAFTLH